MFLRPQRDVVFWSLTTLAGLIARPETSWAELDVHEPMVFDLVRGLDSPAGQIEMNTLLIYEPDRPGDLSWSPEVEWVIMRGFAVEGELGFVNGELHAIKTAVQFSSRVPEGGRLGHGLQVLAEYEPQQEELVATPLYLIGWRFAPQLSLMGIMGPAFQIPFDGTDGDEAVPDRGGPIDDQTDADRFRAGGLFNATIFLDLSERWVVGLEQNLEFFGDALFYRVLPQFQWDVVDHFNLQFGGGATYASEADTRWAAEIVARVIFEF